MKNQGKMVTVLSFQEMRALEKAAFDSGAVSSRDLMETAGKGVVEAIKECWADSRVVQSRAIVLCGPGNNGGDGFVVARHLAKLGHEVHVCFYGNQEKLSADARHNFDLWDEEPKNSIYSFRFPDLSSEDIKCVERMFAFEGSLMLVDALFGIGLDRPLTTLKPVIEAHCARRNNYPFPETLCVAVDVPSGLADDGPVADQESLVFYADLTVTFHQIKKAHVAAPEYCGKVHVYDIGL